MRRVMIALVLMATLPPPAPQPVQDERVQAACDLFDTLKSQAVADGEYARHLRWKVADEALDGVSPRWLTVEQIRMLSDAGVLEYTRQKPAFGARLAALSRDTGSQGARAALMRLSLINGRVPDEDRVLWLNLAFSHPGLPQVMDETVTWNAITSLSELEPPVLAGARDALLRAGALVDERIGVEGAIALSTFMEAIVIACDGENANERERIRRAFVDAATSVSNRAGSGQVAARIKETTRRLEGAHLRGELIGHPAPTMEILWTSTDEPVRSLEDLKGRVVVLDFWATWCGPCIASFRDVRKLHEHYQGFDVIVLAVTSLQGFHMAYDNGPRSRPKRVNTRGRPQREFELMRDFMTQKDMTWPVAFTKQDVYNPDFGVRGIPHVAIVDAAGVVRHRGLHPMSLFTPFEEKTAMIDALLREAGLETPDVPEDADGG